MAAPRRVRTALLTMTAVAGGLLLGVVGASFSYTGPGRSPYCGRCHEIRPTMQVWEQSTHRGVACEACHGSALSFNLRFHLKNLGRVVHHARGEVAADLRLGPQDVLDMQARCQACHAREFAEWQGGPHGATYADIFLDKAHNERVPLMEDCLRCHGMFFEGGIADLVAPIDRKGPWRLSDPALASAPVMPCLTCHAVHREGRPEQVRHGRTPAAGTSQPVHAAGLGLFDRRSQQFIPVDALALPSMRLGNRALQMSPDGRQALCYQCHAPRAGAQAFTADDRTTSGVHEGIGCLGCHQRHGQRTRASCASCHPRLSNCGLDVEKMDTTFRSPESAHDVHSVTCAECHVKGVPQRKTARPSMAAATLATR
jgi:hypothetical protein